MATVLQNMSPIKNRISFEFRTNSENTAPHLYLMENGTIFMDFFFPPQLEQTLVKILLSLLPGRL